MAEPHPNKHCACIRAPPERVPCPPPQRPRFHCHCIPASPASERCHWPDPTWRRGLEAEPHPNRLCLHPYRAPPRCPPFPCITHHRHSERCWRWTALQCAVSSFPLSQCHHITGHEAHECCHWKWPAGSYQDWRHPLQKKNRLAPSQFTAIMHA